MMKGKKFLFLKLLLIVILAFTLIGCPEAFQEDEEVEEEEKTYSLKGYWKSAFGDGFEITSTTFYQYDDATKTVSFAGDIANNPNFEASEGYITILITDTGTWGKTVGEYYRVHWEDFSKNNIKESSAWKAGGASTMPTQAGAETEYTVANGYFAIHADYTRQ